MNYENIDWNKAVQNTLADYEKGKTATTTVGNGVDLKKYFSLALPEKVNTEEKVFRILPLTAEDPLTYFAIVKFHNLKIGKKWAKLYDPAQDGEESPLNDIFKILNKGDKDEKALANTYRSRDFYIIRGIERGKEHEGPKFWRFNKVGDGSGIMDKLIPLMKRLDEKKPGGGAIWRPDGMGRDIAITTVRDVSKGFTKVSSIMVDEPAPLSEDPAQAEAWLNDKITWKDVYKKKPIEYLRIVAQGNEPAWDSESKKFIAKTEDTQVSNVPPAKEPSQNNYQAPVDTHVEEYDNEEPVSMSVDDLPF
jgi:hypothetical protein